ncbi:hypothetical protein [Mesorhizobium sp.]|nr:hypothetical protein [Mesorhizobium sp.]
MLSGADPPMVAYRFEDSRGGAGPGQDCRLAFVEIVLNDRVRRHERAE